MPPRAFFFECSTQTYLECIEQGLFGSNARWPLQVARGDYCVLHHYEIGTVFALWRAESAGARKIAPRAWGGRFPFQARVSLVSSRVVEIPIDSVNQFIAKATGSEVDHSIEGEPVERLIEMVRGFSPLREP